MVAGCSDSIHKISNSLYGISKSISGQKTPNLRPVDDVCTGSYRVISGSVDEVYTGASGVVEHPSQGCKENGVFGLVKGIGKGLCGFVMVPGS